ncbi:DUF1648 domain-containing protein [Desulfosporosinus sp. FKB]|uniref:DUF1648 domain-containing protein n=1 Tax=Desulfosporosinus sp. FKB TaxID=1969835 RepID=UPI000B4A36D8|nr:DUF1648 domain-containing protein [Desulfosporosinus sp. FKB]
MIESSSKEKLPRIQMHRSLLENIFDIGAIIGVATSLIYPVIIWSSLPSKIPVHYNIQGQVDRWGSKGEIFLLVLVVVLMYIFLTILNRYPHRFNYPFDITEQNAEIQYKLARLMVQALKMEVIWIFAYIQWRTIEGAMGKELGLGIGFILISILLPLVTLIFYIWRAFKAK